MRTFAEREDSPLSGRILRFYPQGSMAIDATISTRGTDEEYDLDIVAELHLSASSDPGRVLDLLEEALDGYPTAMGIERQTRCVTVRYGDGMHLDVTPAIRRPGEIERASNIFHANPEKPVSEHYRVPMNAWAFADWYRGRTPLEPRFATAFNRRMFDAYGMRAKAAAEVDDVPEQAPLIVKSTATVALQLLKRFRNIAYANASGRIPPSVMMSCFAGHAARPGTPLSEMVIRQARLISRAIAAASPRRERVQVPNPVYPNDCFTDRWPENIAQQDAFARKLTELADGLEYFQKNDITIEHLQNWLRERFGERVVTRSVKQFNDRLGGAVKSATPGYSRHGGIYLPNVNRLAGASAAVAATPAIARPHTFMGGVRL